jgi:hypothetical protein
MWAVSAKILYFDTFWTVSRWENTKLIYNGINKFINNISDGRIDRSPSPFQSSLASSGCSLPCFGKRS